MVRGADDSGATHSIHFRPAEMHAEPIDFLADAKSIKRILMLACPTGTLVELARLIQEELRR